MVYTCTTNPGLDIVQLPGGQFNQGKAVIDLSGNRLKGIKLSHFLGGGLSELFPLAQMLLQSFLAVSLLKQGRLGPPLSPGRPRLAVPAGPPDPTADAADGPSPIDAP